jgi:phage repressor protein C with HTH and peptisase S24 domain
METFAARVSRAMKLRGLTPADLIAQKVLSKAGVYFILDGTTKPDKIRATTIEKLCRALGVSREWLMTGKGPMEPQDAANDPDWKDITASTQGIAAGAGAVPDNWAETHKLKFRQSSLLRKGLKPAALLVHYARGDSMEPKIKDGDALLIDTADTKIRDGGIYWIRYDGDHFIKVLQKVKRQVVIESLNKSNPQWAKPIIVQEGDDFEVVGRLRWIGAWID